MATLLIILVVGAAAISALTYPLRPKSTVVVSVVTATIGASAYALLLFGPKDYMLRIPSSMTTLLHPWVLGGIGGLLLTLGVGGIIGFSARLLMSTKDFNNRRGKSVIREDPVKPALTAFKNRVGRTRRRQRMKKPTGVTAMAVMLGVFPMGGAVPAKTTSESMPEPIQKLPVLGSIEWQNQPLPFVPTGPRAGISGSGMVVHRGQIYLMGGFIPGGDETESTSRRTSHWTHRYDLPTGKWERLADMPGRREYTRAIVAGDAIYVMGGGSQGVGAARQYAPFADCFRLDLSQDPPVWTEHSQLTVARTHMGTGLIGTNLLVVAGGNEYSREVKGYHKSTIRDTVDIFDLSQPGRGWQRRAPLPGPRGWVASSVSGGRLYVFGGLSFLASNSQIRFRDGFRYDAKQDRWESRAAFPLPISGWEAATLNERFIIAVGGVLLGEDRPIQDATSELVEHTFWNDLAFGYDTQEDRWYRLEGPMPGGGVFNDPSVCIVGDVIYVVGAEGPKGSHFNHFLKGQILLKREP